MDTLGSQPAASPASNGAATLDRRSISSGRGICIPMLVLLLPLLLLLGWARLGISGFRLCVLHQCRN